MFNKYYIFFILTIFSTKTEATNKNFDFRIEPTINTSNGLFPYREQSNATFGVHMKCKKSDDTYLHFGNKKKIYDLEAKKDQKLQMPARCKFNGGLIRIYISHILLDRIYTDGPDYNNWPNIDVEIDNTMTLQGNEPRIVLTYEFTENLDPFLGIEN
ncbi:hypothetical protein Mgra_00008604 [Meloidogyne graminicola]|uniref:Galectin n=1 Tax=Meloidogyne graminicola TaxID=189291 RepID=A0A8S9ZFD1_9BILA|nr:hypothetical protein Mgra_00008604 [Meloidogyne graminicola]